MIHPELLWFATPPLAAVVLQRDLSPHPTVPFLRKRNANCRCISSCRIVIIAQLNQFGIGCSTMSRCLSDLCSPQPALLLSRSPASPPRSELQDAVGAAPLGRCSAALVDAFVRSESYIGSARVCTESDSPPCAFSYLLNTRKHDDDELERPRTQRHPLRRRRRRCSAQLLRRPRRHLSSSPSPP
ncbi:hypothetical protein C8F01DRAFT_1370232 [Mycena amicta]|nr:hypothetical protein C8F01DRAFT_1370232 [Mycena amicta]